MDNKSTGNSQLVADNEDLYRRLTVSSWIKKKEDGSLRPSSAVYINRFGEVSVDIASKTTPEKSIKGACGLVCMLAKIPQKLGYPVVEDPIEEDKEQGIEENLAHALIKGKITKSHAKQMALASLWAIEPKI